MNSGRQRARPGQPRQRDDRPGAAARRAQRRRRPARARGPRRPRPAGQVRLRASPSASTRRAPWPGLAQARGVPRATRPGVTLFAGEAPRLVVDQLAREPEALARIARAGARERGLAAPAPRVRRDAASSAPSTAASSARPAGRASGSRSELFERTARRRPASSSAAPAASPEGIEPRVGRRSRDAGGEVRRARPDPARLRRRRRRPVLDGLRRLGRRAR